MEFAFLSQIIEKAGGRTFPLWGQFELLPVCNLRCPMCYVHSPAEDRRNMQKLLPASFWIDIARQAIDEGMLVLSITGGETLLYPELDTLLEALSGMGIIISFNTNGTLIDEKQVARIGKYSIAKINLTLYGGSDETYKKVTGCSDGFSRVSRAIDLLQKAGQNVYLNGTLVPDNINDLPEMIEFAKMKGLVLHETTYMFPKRTTCRNDVLEKQGNLYRLLPNEAAIASNSYIRLTNGEKEYREAAAINAFREYIISSQTKRTSRMKACRAGRYEFAVDWTGRLQPCVLFTAIQEDLKKQVFSDAWKNCVARMKRISLPQKCSMCSHLDTCPVCPAAVYLETGTHDTAPEYLCRFSDEALNIWKQDSKNVHVRLGASDKLLNNIDNQGCEI